MTRLPVHCCCNPALRLGTVEVPGQIYPRPVVFVIPPAMANRPIPGELVGHDLAMEPARKIWTEIQFLHFAGTESDAFMAVKSADVPLDVWRQVPGFIPEGD